MYKSNKTHESIPSQSTTANKKTFIESGMQAKTFDNHVIPKVQTSKLKPNQPEVLAISPGKLRENNIQEFYHTKGGKVIESSRTNNPNPRYLKLYIHHS